MRLIDNPVPGWSRAKAIDITGTGDSVMVHSTVINIMEQFILKVKPKVLLFDAVESNRKRLYDSLFLNRKTFSSFNLKRMPIRTGFDYTLEVEYT